jgi:hypothetical protein
LEHGNRDLCTEPDISCGAAEVVGAAGDHDTGQEILILLAAPSLDGAVA